MTLAVVEVTSGKDTLDGVPGTVNNNCFTLKYYFLTLTFIKQILLTIFKSLNSGNWSG